MGNVITIARTPVATFENEVSKIIHWNFQTILLVSLTNAIAETSN